MAIERGAILKGVALSTLVFSVDGIQLTLSPRQAHAVNIPLQVLKPTERAALEAFGEVLLPGAKDAGIANYVDHQLAGNSQDCLLVARALNISPPYYDFYRAGLAALDRTAHAAHQKPFAELGAGAQVEFVRAMTYKSPEGWQGPPSTLFCFVARNDATDVVYGTIEDFEKLNLPFMQHVLPARYRAAQRSGTESSPSTT